MKKGIFFLLFAFSFGLYAQNLTLKESLNIGMKNSKNVRLIKIKYQLASLQIKKIKAAFFPEFKLSASYSRLSNIPPFEIQTPFSPKPIKIQDPILNNYSFSMGFQLPVFVGFRLVNLLKASENNALSTSYETIYKMNEEAIKITSAFFNFEKSLLVYKLTKEETKRLKKHLTDAKNLADEGLLLKSELLKIKSKLEEIKYKLEEARNAVIIARTVFNKALGLPLNSQTNIKFDYSVKNKLNLTLEQAINKAFNKRFELKAFQSRLKAAANNVKAEEAGYWPNVSIFGNYYYNRPNQRILPLKDEFKDTWAVGMAFSWDLWSGGKTKANVQIAKEKLLEASVNFKILKENIEAQVTKNYLALKSAYKKILAASSSFKAAKENLRVINKMYNQQKATASDLLDAESDFLNSQINFKLAQLNAKFKRIELLKSLGEKIY